MSNVDFSEEEIKEFLNEAEELLAIAEDALLKLESGAAFSSNYDSIFRAFHSIKGAAGMLGLDSVQHHMHITENNFQSLKAIGSISKEQISYFLKSIDHVRNLLQKKDGHFVESFPATSQAPVDSETTKVESNTIIPTPNNTKLRAMVIDDEADIVEILKDTLESVDFEVYPYTLPELATQELSKVKPDVVCTDMKMPKMSGFDVLKKVQEYDEDIPIIFISGHMDKEMVIDSMSEGAYSVIEKPFRETTVYNTSLSAARRHQTLKLLTKSINLLMVNISELIAFYESNNKQDEAKLIKDELNQLIHARRLLRSNSKK